MDVNEIRDFLARAPKRCHFDGRGMVYNTAARYRWLASIADGSIHERINRRAGIVDKWLPWKTPPVLSAQRRHERRQRVIAFGRD